MNVRTKFTLGISLTSFIAALLFSVFVYSEMIEEPHKLIARELLDTAKAVMQAATTAQDPTTVSSLTDYPLERYYIRISGEGSRTLFSSQLATLVDIPLQPKDGFSTIIRQLSPQHIWLDPLEDDSHDEINDDKIRFKMVQLSGKRGKETIQVVVAKPLAMFSSELQDIVHELLFYIVLATIFIIMVSFFLAGKLLEPISKINRKIKNIRENSLDDRIPIGKSKDEIYTLSVSLNAMFDRLNNSFRQQKEFISNASHEMKIPLTVVMLSHEEMLSRSLPDSLRDEIGRQLTNLQRLNKLVKDLLDISQLEHREFIKRNRVNLSLLIEKVLNNFDEMLQAAGIICTTRIERLTISGDYNKLLRVFVNLIDNAIKYNLPSQGCIFITASKEKDDAKVVMENSGSDIPADDLPHIFEQFYRVEKSRSIHYGGTGLGLTIVKRIIELHGCTVSAESGGGKTTITFYLPLDPDFS